MRVTTEINLNYGLTLIKLEITFYSTFVGFVYAKSTRYPRDESVRKVHVIRWNRTEYRDHYQWVKQAWFDNSVKPPYHLLVDYDIVPF